MQIVKVEKGSCLWEALTEYAEQSPWVAGKHLADMLRQERFSDWESVFTALEEDEIIGYCTFLKEDYYPENRYSPWIFSLDQHDLCRSCAQGLPREPEDD